MLMDYRCESCKTEMNANAFRGECPVCGNGTVTEIQSAGDLDSTRSRTTRSRKRVGQPRAKYTPGPWSVEPHHCECFDGDEESVDGFDVRGPDTLGDMECPAFRLEDARLIAASPDLIEACRAARDYLQPNLLVPESTIFWKLVYAINKAEGRA